ncbi:MAG TPA: PEP-CTERM sorting domain-containing protein [Fimbriimonadaceae bacterium]|nr:PEP-CTERM sorting domain-containing protein [Fimbriimonadaceae bacterium]
MKLRQLLLIASLVCVSSTSFSQVVFYGGDANGVDGLTSEEDGVVSQAMTYDNFTVGAGGWNVSDLGGIFAVTTGSNFASARYEIRQGVSVGNGGSLIQTGVFSVSSSSVGSLFGRDLRDFTGSVSPFSLAAGNYWIGISLIDPGSVRSFVATTSGVNGVGGPLNDGNSFLNSSTFAANFDDAGDFIIEDRTPDFAYRITAAPVPEPATLGALGMGALALLRRRKKVN